MQPHLNHESLDIYGVARAFLAWATDLMAELHDAPEMRARRLAETLDQLDRASLSILLNTAEGNGRRQSRPRAKFFDDARGSAAECAACLDARVSKRACAEGRVEQGEILLVRIVSMLSKLVDRFSGPMEMREEHAQYRIEDEDDDDEKGDDGKGTS